MAKRGFDLIFSIIGLLLLFPLLLLIAVLIKLDSKGPVLFIQGRVGKNNSRKYAYHFLLDKFTAQTTIFCPTSTWIISAQVRARKNCWMFIFQKILHATLLLDSVSSFFSLHSTGKSLRISTLDFSFTFCPSISQREREDCNYQYFLVVGWAPMKR